jgi:hypothetical protein
MDVALLVLRLLLALVFAVAAVAKLADRPSFRETLAEFGVPRVLTGGGALMLPLTELVVAALLSPAATARVAAGAALALLVVFCAAVAAALARGARPACACFGSVRSTPVGRGTLARNALLGGAAAAVAIEPGAALPALSPAVVLGVALALAGWLCQELLRRHGRLLLRLDALEGAAAGLPVGAPAPRFALLDGLLARGLPVALVFTDAECGPCREAVPVLAAEQRRLAGRLAVAVISRGATQHGLDNVEVVADHDLALSYGIVGTPAAVLVSAEGRVNSRAALGLDEIVELLDRESRPPARSGVALHVQTA